MEDFKLKYIVSFKTKFGTISAETKDPRDLEEAYEQLRSLASRIGSKHAPKSKRTVEKQESRQGKGETARILREVQMKLLQSDFFTQPRSTGETTERLLKATHQSFTSRKVSQALGILWKKRLLKRTGKRNFYVYSK
jgi:hypothetical protein